MSANSGLGGMLCTVLSSFCHTPRPSLPYDESLLLYDPDDYDSLPPDSPHVSMFTALFAQRIFHRAIQGPFTTTVKFYVYATFRLANKKNQRF